MNGGAEVIALMMNGLAWMGTSYQQGWANFGAAWSIYTNPNATLWQRLGAGLYMGTWLSAHIVLAAGLYLLADAAIAAVAPAVLTALFAYLPTINTVANVAGIIGEGYLIYRAVFLHDQDAGMALIAGYQITGASALVNGLSSIRINFTPTEFSIPNLFPSFSPNGGMASWSSTTTWVMDSPSVQVGSLGIADVGESAGMLGSYAMMSGNGGGGARDPRPPGFNPRWRKDGQYWVDPKTGERWRYHPEDATHWPHWDVYTPGLGGHERIPIPPYTEVFK